MRQDDGSNSAGTGVVNDRALIQAMLGGDERSFRLFFDTYFPRVYRFALEALLREVGRRDEPSAAAMAEVRRTVHGEWLATISQRKRQRRVFAFAIAASIAFVTVLAGWTLRFAAPDAEFAVTVARIAGDARLQTIPASRGHTIKVGDTVAIGSVLTTDDEMRVALAFGPGTSIRIDRGSKIERVSPSRFRLSAGAVYIDAQPQAEHHELLIETRAGDVQHVGTQYQVRQSGQVVEVSIREGRVQIAGSHGTALASAGERVHIAAAGEVRRGAISGQDPAWEWAEATSPVFALDNRTLAEFLEWVARETGRQVVYASPEARRRAEALKLHGSIDGLDLDTALSAVLSTTDLMQYESGNGLIGVRLAMSDD